MRSIGAVMRTPRTGRPLPDFASYCAAWSGLHAGYDVAAGSAWVRGCLRMQYRLARPLAAAGVSPALLTAGTALLGAGAVAAAMAGGRWPLVAAGLVAAAGVGDGLDGAVAVLSDRVTAWGYVLDSAADRVVELLFLVALAAVGAAWSWVAVCAALIFLLEYVRARAGNAGAGEVTAITVGERPNRVVFCALGLAGAGAVPAFAALIANGAVAALAVLSLIGLVQLVLAVRRQLEASAPGR